jgi:hypothetical protein
MAKHKLSAMFSDLRGKLNGSKFSKGRSAHTLTNKVKGSNPQTSYQGKTRSLFRKYTAKWRTLGADSILAWNAAANEVSKSNAFGDSYKTTGHKYYVTCNVNAGLHGAAEVATPPTIVIPALVDIGTLSLNHTGPVVKVTTDIDIPTGCTLILTATPPVSAGKTNLKGLHRVFYEKAAPLVAGEIDLHTEYVARFGSPLAGKKIEIRAYTTDTLKVAKFKALHDLVGLVT